MVEAANTARAMGTGFKQWKHLFSPLYRPQLITIIAMAAFNQLDGINTIMFYVRARPVSAALGARLVRVWLRCSGRNAGMGWGKDVRTRRVRQERLGALSHGP